MAAGGNCDADVDPLVLACGGAVSIFSSEELVDFLIMSSSCLCYHAGA